MNSRAILPLLALLLAGLLTSCRDRDRVRPEPASTHHHEHKAPHGGTLVELGAEEYHLEFVREPAMGRLRAYVLDGELEKFIRLTNETITLQVDGQVLPLLLRAVPSNATGESVGDTSAFEAQADWLKSTNQFDAVVPGLNVRAKAYRDIRCRF